MKTKSFNSLSNLARALSHKKRFGKITDNYRLPRKLKKAMKKSDL